MPENQTKGMPRSLRLLSLILGAIVVMALCLGISTQAFAAFGGDSADDVIGVGRIQSLSASSATSDSENRFAVDTLAVLDTAETSVLATPLDRNLAEAEKTVAAATEIKRFGETDENGWFSTLASAYGPSSAGKYTSLGTELTLTSTGIGVTMAYQDLLGRYIYIEYGGVTLLVQIVDTGFGGGPNRLFDLQPGVCTAFGAETPEFGWGVRTIHWRFAS